MKQGWIKKTLGEIYDIEGGKVQTGPFGSQLHQSDYIESGIAVIMPKDIIDDNLNLSNIARISISNANRLKKHKVELDDIIFPRRGDIAKRIIISKEDVGSLCGTGCIRLRGKGKILNPKFLFYYLKQDSVIYWIEQQAIGSTMLNLNTSILRSIPITLPPITIQQQITSILSAYDDLIENNNKRIQLLENMASEIYKEWFLRLRFPNYQQTKIENGVPEGWEKKKLKDLIVFEKGKNPKEIFEEEAENSIPYLNMDAIDKGGKSWVSTEKQVIVNRNDVIMVMDGSRSSLVFRGKEGAVGNTLSKLRFVDDNEVAVKNCMLYYFLKLNHEAIRANNTGSAIPHANKKYIHSLPFLIPSDTILESFKNSILSIQDLIDNLHKKNKLLQHTRDLLLPRLISGKLEV